MAGKPPADGAQPSGMKGIIVTVVISLLILSTKDSEMDKWLSSFEHCNLRGVNDVLARQAGDVRASSSDVLAFDHSNALPLPGEGPCGEFRSRPTADNHEIIFFRAIVHG